jgi:hypothetical protein
VKRGWIAWDQSELPGGAFESRLAAARQELADRDLPALVVYTDIWRSNQGRYFSNFMPYWNRALLVIPREEPPFLLCGLSPRVYPWIKSVTILEDIVPSPNLPEQLLKAASSRGWQKVGVLSLHQLPHDLYQQVTSRIDAVDVPDFVKPDEWALGMYRRAIQMAREVLEQESPHITGVSGYEFASRLERKLRRAGAEDLIILLTNGDTAPRPPQALALSENFSVVLALEYRGHWVKLARTAAEPSSVSVHQTFFENLSGPYPFEQAESETAVFAIMQEFRAGNARLFEGDTFHRTPDGLDRL